MHQGQVTEYARPVGGSGGGSGIVPRRPAPGASEVERLRYVRQWAIVSAFAAIPGWALVLLFVHTPFVILLLVVVNALSLANIASLTWRINRGERG
jgi:hypothetical protein